MQNTVNEFTASGVILSIARTSNGEKTIRMVVHGRRFDSYLDMLPEKTVDVSDIVLGQHVIAKGYVRGYSYENEITKRISRVTRFVVSSIEPEKTLLEKRFGNKGSEFYPEASFVGFVAGRVTEVRVTGEDWRVLTVETAGGTDDKRPSYVDLTYYTKGRLPLCDYEKNDVVEVHFSARTKPKESAAVKRYGLPEPKKKIAYYMQSVAVENIAYRECNHLCEEMRSVPVDSDLKKEKEPGVDLDSIFGVIV